MVRGRWSKLVLAMAAAGATFGIVTAVQAAIPDAQGIAHGCVAKNVPLPNNKFLRMVDSEIGERCLPTEWVVDLASQAFVEQRQTSFMTRIVQTLSPGQWVGTMVCPAGYVATDVSLAPTDESFGSAALFTMQSFSNQGMVTTGTPNNVGLVFFNLTGSPSTTAHTTCVDGRVFGQAGPLAPIAQHPQATGTFRRPS